MFQVRRRDQLASSARITSAHLLPIIMLGVLVLPDVILGMIAASPSLCDGARE